MRKHERAWDGSRACVETLEGRTLMAAGGADMVLEWNAAAVEATRVAKLSPPVQTRALAMVQGAVYDAVNSIEKSHEPLVVTVRARRWYSQDAAAAISPTAMPPSLASPAGIDASDAS